MANNLPDIGSIFKGFDVSTIVDKLYFFLGILLLAAFLGGIGFLIFKIKKKNNKANNIKKIGWWEEVHGEMSPNEMDDAEEITAPGTALKFFYIKSKNMWLPRFTHGITKNLFYVAITPNRQMINFKLKSLSSDLAEVGLEYDHTDMIAAAENMREFIKRNYKDKSVKWWQLYQNTIATATLIIVMTFSFLLIVYSIHKFLVGDLGPLVNTINKALETSCSRAVGSGIVAA